MMSKVNWTDKKNPLVNKYTGIVYKITNKKNKKIYIGITRRTFNQRYNGDIRNTHNEMLREEIQKYSLRAFQLEILHYGIKKEEDLDRLEIQYIKKFQCLQKQNGYNISSGGGCGNPYEGYTLQQKLNHSAKMSDIKRNMPQEQKNEIYEKRRKRSLDENVKKRDRYEKWLLYKSIMKSSPKGFKKKLDKKIKGRKKDIYFILKMVDELQKEIAMGEERDKKRFIELVNNVGKFSTNDKIVSLKQEKKIEIDNTTIYANYNQFCNIYNQIKVFKKVCVANEDTYIRFASVRNNNVACEICTKSGKKIILTREEYDELCEGRNEH